jgi:hypothetical protein
MPFEPPCFTSEFFLDSKILGIALRLMGDMIVADQWACDAPVNGSQHQGAHVDYQHPLFPEHPDMALPFYMLVVSFGLVDIGLDNGPLELASGTHRMPRNEALDAVAQGRIKLEPVPLRMGDVLIRHPWALRTEEVPIKLNSPALYSQFGMCVTGMQTSVVMLGTFLKGHGAGSHRNSKNLCGIQ